jgi:tight adherence protein B
MRHRARSVLLLGVLLALAAGGPALAADQPVKIRGVDVGGYPTVAVNAEIDSSTRPEDIRVTENGSPVSILTVRPLIESGQEIDVVLAIDTSRSIQGAPLQAAIAAARAFLAGLPEGVAVGVVTFSDQVRVVLQITADRAAVLRALDSIKTTQAGTALYDAVEEAAGMFAGSAQRNILLLTDGKDFGSRNDLPAAVAAAQRAHAATFTIGLQGTSTDFGALETLATKTGGTFAPAATADLAQVYSELAARLSQQYLILYRSRAPGGAQVTVSVETPGGKDSSIVLMPHLATKAAPGREGSKPLLAGSWALATVLSLSFIAVFMLLFLPLQGLTRARREGVLAARMRAQPAGAPPAHDRAARSLTGWIPDPLVRGAEHVADAAGFRASLDRRLEAAGLPIRAGEILAVSFIGAAIVGILVAVMLRSVLIAVPLAAVTAAVPFVLLARAIDRRINALNQQLPDVLLILASSMRAGHSFLQALDTVSKEVGEPSGPEFARVVAEIRLGRPFDEAITAMAERVGSEEFKWAMLAVNIQREVGGNLAEILDTLADTVREREAVRRQIKVLSSEGRLSIRILIALPFLITLYVAKFNPGYMKLLWTTWVGLVMIGVGAFLMLVGVIWARKIVRIDV